MLGAAGAFFLSFLPSSLPSFLPFLFELPLKETIPKNGLAAQDTLDMLCNTRIDWTLFGGPCLPVKVQICS